MQRIAADITVTYECDYSCTWECDNIYGEQDAHAGAIIQEDGFFILLEDGSGHILLE